MSRMITALMCFLPSQALAFDDQAIIAKCDEDWGTDFQMVKYCRDQQRAAGKQFDALKERAKTREADEVILKNCEGNWGSDYEMVIYYHRQQSKALTSLTQRPQEVPSNTYDIIERQCVVDWSTDFEMVAYCIEQQTSAWRELQ